MKVLDFFDLESISDLRNISENGVLEAFQLKAKEELVSRPDAQESDLFKLWKEGVSGSAIRFKAAKALLSRPDVRLGFLAELCRGNHCREFTEKAEDLIVKRAGTEPAELLSIYRSLDYHSRGRCIELEKAIAEHIEQLTTINLCKFSLAATSEHVALKAISALFERPDVSVEQLLMFLPMKTREDPGSYKFLHEREMRLAEDGYLHNFRRNSESVAHKALDVILRRADVSAELLCTLSAKASMVGITHRILDALAARSDVKGKQLLDLYELTFREAYHGRHERYGLIRKRIGEILLSHPEMTSDDELYSRSIRWKKNRNEVLSRDVRGPMTPADYEVMENGVRMLKEELFRRRLQNIKSIFQFFRK